MSIYRLSTLHPCPDNLFTITFYFSLRAKRKTAPLKAELSNTGKPGFILFLCLCGFLGFSLVLAVEPAELIHCKRAEERCDDGDEDKRSDAHGRGEDKSDNADHYREDGNLPVLREVGRGERAEERGQNLLESGGDVGVGGQRGEHRTEREHADCEDYSSRDSRGRNSDSRAVSYTHLRAHET